MKNTIKKMKNYKLAIGSCVLISSLCLGVWVVVGDTSITSIGKDIHTGGDMIVDGNLGVGAAVPEDKLHVIGDSKLSGDLHVEHDTILSGEVSVDGSRITELLTPVEGSDAVTKEYVQASAGGGGSGGATIWELRRTSNTYDGNLGGFEGANAKCKSEFGSTASFSCASAMVSDTPFYINSNNMGYVWIDHDIVYDTAVGFVLSGGSRNSCRMWTMDREEIWGTQIDGRVGFAFAWYESETRGCHRNHALCCAIPR